MFWSLCEPSLVKNPKYKRIKKDSKANSGSKKKTIKFPEELKETQVNDPKYSKMKCFNNDCGGPHDVYSPRLACRERVLCTSQ